MIRRRWPESIVNADHPRGRPGPDQPLIEVSRAGPLVIRSSDVGGCWRGPRTMGRPQLRCQRSLRRTWAGCSRTGIAGHRSCAALRRHFAPLRSLVSRAPTMATPSRWDGTACTPCRSVPRRPIAPRHVRRRWIPTSSSCTSTTSRSLRGQHEGLGGKSHSFAGCPPIADGTAHLTAAISEKARDVPFHEHLDAHGHGSLLQGADQLQPGAVTDMGQAGVAMATEVALEDTTVFGAVDKGPQASSS